MKKIISLMMVLVLTFSLVACGAKDGGGGEGASKIGIVTGTVSQGEEGFRTGEGLLAEYGPDKIKHITYPDKFDKEVETTISQIAALAADKDVKAIVMYEAIPGISAAIDQIKETRPDMLFVLGAPHEDVEVVTPRADIILELDQLTRGSEIIKKAKDMGAETFIHYSFPRHLSMELLAARRDEFKKACEKEGLAFIEVDAPDPTSDAGVPGAQQFILEDVPRQVAKYGKNTAFFSTNCSMMEPLIKQTLAERAIFPEQCCPSPYHAYPGALGIEIPDDKANDIDFLNEQIAEKIAAKGGTGRFGTWTQPAAKVILEAGTKYAMEYADGKIEKFDPVRMEELMKEVTNDKGDLKIRPLDAEHEKFLVFVLGPEIF